MNGRRMVVGTVLATGLALGAAAPAGAHWEDPWDHHGPASYPGCDWDDHGMGPGMMDPYPACDWPDHGMGSHPHDGWWDD
jgi:hypothetical protein